MKPSSARRYATSTTGEPLTIEGPEVFVDLTGIRIGGGPLLVPLVGDGADGFPAEHKARGTQVDLELRALRAALSQEPTGKVLTLHVDPRVTYRMLVELLFTAGQSGFSSIRFVVVEGGGEARRSLLLELPNAASGAGKPFPAASAKKLLDELDGLSMKALGAGAGTPGAKAPMPTPTPSAPPVAPFVCGSLPLSLAVVVATQGFYVKALSASIAPGCASFGAGPTVPLLGDRDDFSALRVCVAKLHDCHPSYASDGVVRVGMNGASNFQRLVSTWDALRRREDGKPLMPDLQLTVPH